MARRKGVPNLKKTETGFINQHGIEFTVAEKKALESKVNSANRKRKKMQEEFAYLERKHEGVKIGDTVIQKKFMGHEGDFIIAQRTKSLQRFKNREQFERYMRNLDVVNRPNYVDDRIRLYKRNFMKSLEDVYGDDARDIVMKVRMMKPRDYMKMVEADETLEISYVPSDVKVQGRLNQLRRALGMNEKSEWADETINVNK